MPALTKRRVGSLLGRTGEDGTHLCWWCTSKKSINVRRTLLDVKYLVFGEYDLGMHSLKLNKWVKLTFMNALLRHLRILMCAAILAGLGQRVKSEPV